MLLTILLRGATAGKDFLAPKGLSLLRRLGQISLCFQDAPVDFAKARSYLANFLISIVFLLFASWFEAMQVLPAVHPGALENITRTPPLTGSSN